ncbi:hypothetical protein BC829DRAFT_406878 [Chytridium lagenaria]|nr:hypothetical protein BC829DRAFT_406878 [Chytridium lagenaria]
MTITRSANVVSAISGISVNSKDLSSSIRARAKKVVQESSAATTKLVKDVESGSFRGKPGSAEVGKLVIGVAVCLAFVLGMVYSFVTEHWTPDPMHSGLLNSASIMSTSLPGSVQDSSLLCGTPENPCDFLKNVVPREEYLTIGSRSFVITADALCETIDGVYVCHQRIA